MNTNTAEIKNYLHKLIVETDDESILSKVEAYFTTLKSKNVDWWETLSNHEKDMIHEGLHQLKNGERIPYEDVKSKVDSLLNR